MKNNINDILINFLVWINETTLKTPMRLETDNDDIVQMFINESNLKLSIEPNFLPVLQENWQAQIAGFYNVDKTLEEQEQRKKVIAEYQDLIAIYKNMKKNLNP